MHFQTLTDLKKHILLLMDYATPPEYRSEAKKLVALYENDIIGLNLLNEFYSFLPEARDDCVTRLRLIDHKQGRFLICVSTLIDNYLYIVTAEAAEFLGHHTGGIWDDEVLDFYGYADRSSFIKFCGNIEKFVEYRPETRKENLCPACSVGSGECHIFGCPVEICPECGGQLVNCNCRFTLLDKDSLDNASQLEQLRHHLEDKGRIPYDAKLHRPTYLTKDRLDPKNKS